MPDELIPAAQGCVSLYWLIDGIRKGEIGCFGVAVWVVAATILLLGQRLVCRLNAERLTREARRQREREERGVEFDPWPRRRI